MVTTSLKNAVKGLVPIETIKVGDYVLSKPNDNQGNTSYNFVTNTFIGDDKEVWYLEYILIEKGEQSQNSGFIVATPDQPILVIGRVEYSRAIRDFVITPIDDSFKWSRLDNLEPDQVLELADGKHVYVSYLQPLLAMKDPNKGWLQGDCLDYYQDYDEGRVVTFGEFGPTTDLEYPRHHELVKNDLKNHDGSYIPLNIKVYHIETNDNQTYFVGPLGVLVHACSCD